MFRGSIVALVTPFLSSGELDTETIERLSLLHADSGTDGILVAGCTGESFTLKDDERLMLLNTVASAVGGKIPVIVGTGASSTSVAVRRTKAAMDAGADGALVITPFGNKPSQHAMETYFNEVADVGLPVILYNVPGRTGSCISPETATGLFEHPNIFAIKEASGSLDAVSRIIRDSDLTVLSGDDSLTLPMISLGASGVISTVANLLPADFADMVHFALDGDFAKAAELHLKMFPVMKALFIEGNPVPLKAAMEYAGIIPGANLRPPLSPMNDANRRKLIEILDEYGVGE